MNINQLKDTALRSLLSLALGASVVLLIATLSRAQNQNSNAPPVVSPTTASAQPPSEPVYREYKSVSLGTTTEEAREKLGKPKSKGPKQDFYVFSEQETAQVFYREQKVFAISVTYIGENSGAPAPMDVLGVDLTPKKNGSMYKLVRYPEAGYWVSYSRTAGKSPITTVTMQKRRTSKR